MHSANRPIESQKADVLVTALRPVATVGVGERGRCDQQAAGLRHDPALLVQEFGLAGLEPVVEVERPQQVPVQGLAPGVAGIELAVPVRVAAFAGALDRAWRESASTTGEACT